MFLLMKNWRNGQIKTGIYCIRNRVNGKRYIGSSATDLLARCRGHRLDLRMGWQKNRHLQSSWNKYGEKAFVFEVVELCEPKKCLRREQYWMDFYKTRDSKFGYNKAKAEGGMLGYKMTPEQRKRNSEAHKGLKRPQYAIDATAAARRGSKHSEATKAHWSRIRKGRPRPIEATIKAADSNRGKKRSPEFCKLMSEMAKKREAKLRGVPKHTPESKAKIAAATRVRWGDEEAKKTTVEKISRALLKRGGGHFHHTEETKRRISERMVVVRKEQERLRSPLG
jgi:group I intron endonuclease